MMLGQGEGWRTCVVGPGAPGEDLEEGVVRCVFSGSGLQSCDVGGLEEFGEDIGIWGGGRLVYEVGGGAGRSG